MVMILCDKSLMNLISNYDLIDDYESSQIQPASIDLRIDQTLILEPKLFALGSTMEYIKIPSKYVGRVEGKSSWGRLGLAIHITAGYIDPGFEGNITLELYNFSHKTITIERGTTICQMAVEMLDNEPLKVYGDETLQSHYQGQTGITKSYMQKED